MKYLLLSAISVLFATPTNGQTLATVEGYRFYKALDLFRVFDAPDSVLTDMENRFSRLNSADLSEKEMEEFGLILHTMENNLLRAPYVHIQTDREEEFMLFMDSLAYQRFEQFTLSELSEKGKKLRVIAEVENVSYRNMTAYKLKGKLTLDMVDGVTHRRK